MGQPEEGFWRIVAEFLRTIPDPQFQPIVNELASRRFQWNLLKAVKLSRKDSLKVGPAASLGIFLNGPVGFVFLAEDLLTNFTPAEMRFIIAHEISHIANSHVIATQITSFFEEILVELFSSELVNLFKILFYLEGQKVLDQKVIRENELQVDKEATDLINDRNIGVAVLEKLAKYYAGGNLDAPSHYSRGRISLPVVSYRERIDNLRSQ